MQLYDPREALLDALVEGHVMAVVGSGFTIASTDDKTPSSWPALIRHAVSYAQVNAGLTAAEAEKLDRQLGSDDAGTLVAAAEKVEQTLKSKPGTFDRWLRASVGEFRIGDDSLLRALRRLGTPLATTNYDTLLSNHVVPWTSDALSLDAIRTASLPNALAQAPVLHLHGVYTVPESIVFGRQSYGAVLADRYAQFRQAVLGTMWTLLFVGCGPGLRDPNFGLLFDELDERRIRHSHFRLVRDSETGNPPAACVTDIVFGSGHDELPRYIELLAADRDRRKLGLSPVPRPRGGAGSRSGSGRESYMLCDSDPTNHGHIPTAIGAEPWSPTGAALPIDVLSQIARALQRGQAMPTLILIDDLCRFSPQEADRPNAARVMSGLTRLFDAYHLEEPERPACVLFTYVPPSMAKQLTFLEFGGHAVADRQLGEEHCHDVVRQALRAAPASRVAWTAPDLLLELDPAKAGSFWADLFPLVPFFDDYATTRKDKIRQALDLTPKELSSRTRELARQLRNDESRLLPPESADDLYTGEVGIAHSAERLGLTWLSRESLRNAANLDWYEILPPGAKPIPELRLRSSRTPALRDRWYQHPDDPRRVEGAEWQLRVTRG